MTKAPVVSVSLFKFIRDLILAGNGENDGFGWAIPEDAEPEDGKRKSNGTNVEDDAPTTGVRSKRTRN